MHCSVNLPKTGHQKLWDSKTAKSLLLSWIQFSQIVFRYHQWSLNFELLFKTSVIFKPFAKCTKRVLYNYENSASYVVQ